MKIFDKIIGYESVKNELYQIIDMFKNKELYEKMGAKFPKGLLIYGNPGMGKTTLANAVIEEINVKTFIIKMNKDILRSIKEIDDVFNEAAKENEAIILIDDIDKFGESESRNHDDKIFATIQTGIDNVKDKKVLVIATGNKIEVLPDSLIRNGRFDRKIYLKSPNSEDAKKIIEYYMSNKCVSTDLNYDDISKMINYRSCADLETIINESAIYAVSKRKSCIEIDDIEKAYLRNKYLVSVESFDSNEEVKESVLFHEAGHTVISEVLNEKSVGFVSTLFDEKQFNEGLTYLCCNPQRRVEAILIALGGKASVELFYEGRCGSGCQNDLKKAAQALVSGIKENAICGLGALSIASNRRESDSEAYSSKIEAIAQAEMERNMFIARDILIKNKDFVYKIVEELKKKKILLHSDIQRIKSSVSITNVSV